MAFQSEVPPPVVGEANKDTFDGDRKSVDEDNDENDTEEEIDLEEGEIPDSDDEGEKEDNSPKKAAASENSSANASSDVSKKTSLSNYMSLSEKAVGLLKTKTSSGTPSKKLGSKSKGNSHSKSVKIGKFTSDRDTTDEDSRDKWYNKTPKKSSGNDDGSFDYDKELAAYREGPRHNSSEDGSPRKKRRRSPTHSKKPLKRLKPRPGPERKKGKFKKGPNSRKICKFYAEGHCREGSDCPFSHSPTKRELCRYYLSGNCSKGKQCPFMHEEFPCKFYHTGAECYSGENCRFSHEPLTAETEKLLKECLKGGHHRDDNYEPRKRLRRSRSRTPEPVPSKRTCLLGSPPRHIREAEETIRWQEEMIHLQREKSSDAFHIRLSPSRQLFIENTMKRSDFSGNGCQSPMRPPMNFKVPESMNMPQNDEEKFINESLLDQDMRPPLDQAIHLPPLLGNTRLTLKRNRHPQQDHDMRPPLVDWKNIQALIEMMSSKENALAVDDVEGSEQMPVLHPEDATYENMNSSSATWANDEPPFLSNDKALYIDFDVSEKDKNNGNRASVTVKTEAFSPREVTPIPSEEDDDEQQSTYSKSPTHGNKSLEQTKIVVKQEPIEFRVKQEPIEIRVKQEPIEIPVKQEPIEIPVKQEPMEIPSHLPRKQRELLLRIQKHQKTKSDKEMNVKKANKSSEGESPIEQKLEESRINDEDDEGTENGDSTDEYDDYDDDADKPLTDVLKKLQEVPPPMPKEVLPQTPKIDLTQVLSNILQKANESGSNAEQNKFWQGILTGTLPPTKSTTPVTSSTCVGPLPPQDNNRHVVPPIPKPMEKPRVETRDPRLKNRDFRTAQSITVPRPSVPVTNTLLPNNLPPIMPLDVRGNVPLPNHHRDLTSVVPNQASVVVEGLAGNVPYKLHGVVTKPLNYTSYIHASHSDPKLLNDPRLRKHLAQAMANDQPNQVEADKVTDASSTNIKSAHLPELPLFSQHMKQQRHDFMPSPFQEDVIIPLISSQPSIDRPTLPEIKLPPLDQQTKVVDPRTARLDQRRLSVSGSPSHPGFTDGLSASIRQPFPPMPASHLPRAISDPRMAKLHHPHDPRRVRTTPTAEIPVAKDKLPQLEPESKPTEKATSKDELEVVVINSDSSDSCDFTSKKSDRNPRKNSAVRRNRNNSMEYASPLNSCDNTNSTNLNYSSYNQRPKKHLPAPLVAGNIPKETLPPASTVLDALMPDFCSSDNSNLDSDNTDINASLKDMFKTIDPTASPFC